MRLVLLPLLLATGVLSQCEMGEVSANGTCLPVVGPRGECKHSAQCQGNSTCTNSRCACTTYNAQIINGNCIVSNTECGLTGVKVKGVCAYYAFPSQGCMGGAQCLGGSTCNSQRACSCPSGTSNFKNYCVSTGNSLNSKCSLDSQCPPNAVCSAFLCRCASGFTEKNGVCNGGEGTGTGGCPTGQMAVNNECMPLASPETQCSASSQCLDKSTCSNGVCQCAVGASVQYVQGNNYCLMAASDCAPSQIRYKGQCLAASPAGSPCVANEQCVGGSACDNLDFGGGSVMCSCPAGQTAMFGYCVPTGSSSSNGCPTGRVKINGVCQLQTAPEPSCQSDQECPANANCQSGSCQCSSGYTQQNGTCVSGSNNPCQNSQIFVNGQCVQKTPIGSFCFMSAQCGENAMCTTNNRTCACNSGYEAVQGNCMQQSGSGSCPLGQVSVNGSCRSLASAGEKCISSLQCIDDTSCVNGTCACFKQNEKIVYNYCILPGTLQGCDVTQTPVNGQCRTYSMINEQCFGDEQCLGGSTCQNQRCSCLSGTVPKSGYCIPDGSSRYSEDRSASKYYK